MRQSHIHKCLACTQRQPPPYAGACACLVDGRDIMEHAALALCPLGRFRWAGLGDAVAWLATVTGIGRFYKAYLADSAPCRVFIADGAEPGRCGCAGRQQALNAAVPFLR